MKIIAPEHRVSDPVESFEDIRASWTNPAGDRITKNLKEWSSRVFQHETDHLDGVDILMKLEVV